MANILEKDKTNKGGKFEFTSLVFWSHSYENTKILHNLCLPFARQDGKKRKRKPRN